MHDLGHNIVCPAFFATAKPFTVHIYKRDYQYLLKYLGKYPSQDTTHPRRVSMDVSEHHSGADRKGEPFSPEILRLCQQLQ